MKAIRIHRFGGPENLVLDEVPDPEPGPGQVVIDVGAAVLGHLDVDIMRGVSRLPFALPHVMGLEAVGRISALGPGVTGWAIGDRVLPSIIVTCGVCRFCRGGDDALCVDLRYQGKTFAERMVCEAAHLTRISMDLPDEQVVAVPTTFGTAWHMLFTRGNLRFGETVLINSVGSGIGSAAVQLAAGAGARVIGTASSDEKLAKAADLGMHHGINYRTESVVEQVRKLTGGLGADLVFEHVGGDSFRWGLESMATNGRMTICGAHSGEVVPVDLIELFRGQRSVIASFGYSKNEAARCLDLAARGAVRPVIHATYPLAEAAAAVTAMERRENFGRIALVMR
ncbi:zinc-binding dehydrogenase [Amycolatopsis jejuensis]|uniref:zinc-binding dehydrogenase n=1 Tax=Amycolatopsis jejuensis TaxID=330084 RepID=UPI000526113B|nr:zinc-binding dehydrogenase [Amycolatopsis jejuensis]